MLRHIALRNAKYVVIFVLLMLALGPWARFNEIHMLQQAQKRGIERVAVQLTDEQLLFGEEQDRGLYMRSELLRISGRGAIQMEWGSLLPNPEVSFEFLERLAKASSAMARLAGRIASEDEWGCWRLPLKSERDDRGNWKYPLVTDKANGVKSMGAHRYTWKLLIDPEIPRSHHVDHLCRVHACCNIAYLEPVTQKINTKRGVDARYIIDGQAVLFHPE